MDDKRGVVLTMDPANAGMDQRVISSGTPAAPVSAPARLSSIDAYRGFVMFLMMAEVLRLARVSSALPESGFWRFLAYHESHVELMGCTLHDLIQPSFSFLVGVALPFSLARRAAEGQKHWRATLHAFWRAIILVLLGVFLRSLDSDHTIWTFEDTLSQIGLGYGFLYMLGSRSTRVQWSAFAAILIGYWLLFALFPLPGPDFNWGKAGVTPEQMLPGFAAHWSLNTNAAWAFDVWFLNLFPPANWFQHNPGGYVTLSFVPTLATMILGLIAGGVIRNQRTPMIKLRWFAIAGVLGIISGWLLGITGVCPVIKRIWTPSWVLFSGGWCFLLLAGFYLVMDVWNRRQWALWLRVLGANSIAAYLIAHLFVIFLEQALPRHLGRSLFMVGGSAYEGLLLGGSVLLVEWLMLFWMYQRKIFLRI